MNDAIEKFLDSEFTGYHARGEDHSFRAWLREVLIETLEYKRAPGCDSDWTHHLFEAMCRVDPKVADVELLRRRDAANAADDWDTADELDEAIHIDYDRAEAAYKTVIDYLLTPR